MKKKIRRGIARILGKAYVFVTTHKIISVTVLVVLIIAIMGICFAACSSKPSGGNQAGTIGNESNTDNANSETDDGGGFFSIFTRKDENGTDAQDDGEEIVDDPVTLAYNADTKEGYMNNCIFLGDSRSVAAVNYGFLQDDNVLAQVGIAHTSFAKNTFTNNSGTQYTMDSFLMSHPAPVVYISLGVNGMNGLDEGKYKSTYEALVDDIISKTPSSKVVIMSIWPVDDNGRYKNSVQNSWINKYNDFLLQLCEKKGIHYLNVNEILTDSNGQMKREYDAGDGLHYAPCAYTDILEYIIHHPVPGVSDTGSFVVKKVAPNLAYQNIDKGNEKAREQIEAETQVAAQLALQAQQEAAKQQHVHSYTGATCTKPGVCSCGEVDPYGKTTNHNYVDGVCSYCGRNDPNYSKHTHSYRPATCTAPETCSCGATRGSAKGHNFGNNAERCLSCNIANPNYVAPSTPGDSGQGGGSTADTPQNTPSGDNGGNTGGSDNGGNTGDSGSGNDGGNDAGGESGDNGGGESGGSAPETQPEPSTEPAPQSDGE